MSTNEARWEHHITHPPGIAEKSEYGSEHPTSRPLVSKEKDGHRRRQPRKKARPATNCWRRIVQAHLSRKMKLTRMILDRLKADNMSYIEVSELASRAIRNYAHFRGLEIGSFELFSLFNRTTQATISDVVISSAGLRGWNAAEVGLAEVVMTIQPSEEAADGWIEVLCTSMGGCTTSVWMSVDATTAELHVSLAAELNVHAHLLRLVLPNARLLVELDMATLLCDLLDEGMLEVGMRVSQLLGTSRVEPGRS